MEETVVLTLDRRRAVVKRVNLEGDMGDEDYKGLGLRHPSVLHFIDDDEDDDVGVVDVAATSSEGNLVLVVLHCNMLGLSKLRAGLVVFWYQTLSYQKFPSQSSVIPSVPPSTCTSNRTI